MPPALHALIIGISDYPYLPGGSEYAGATSYDLEQLTTAARSADSIRAWLVEHEDQMPLPLGSVRTLLAPSASESSLTAGGATLEDLRREALAWRDDCSTDPDNIALMYFAGHGVQRTRTDGVLLLSDFLKLPGGDPLAYGVDVNNFHVGMAPSEGRPDIARTQLFFFDTCRSYPSAFSSFETLRASTVFEVGLSTRDDRFAPIFYGSVPGGEAYARPGGVSLFSQALLECLDGAASVRREGSMFWDVTVDSLTRALSPVVKRLSEEVGADQESFVGGQLSVTDRRIVSGNTAPEVPVSIELRPPTSAGRVQMDVICPDGSTKARWAPLDPNPYSDRWSAGVYRLSVTPPDCGIVDDAMVVMPPAYVWIGEVTT